MRQEGKDGVTNERISKQSMCHKHYISSYSLVFFSFCFSVHIFFGIRVIPRNFPLRPYQISDNKFKGLTILFRSTEEKLCNEILCRIAFRDIFHEPCDMGNHLFIAEVLVKSIRGQYQKSVT